MPATINIEDPSTPPPAPIKGFALFNYGFRPFFFFAALFAVLSIIVWVGLYAGHVDLNLSSPMVLWHAHEMIFGYTTAAIAGFFLTVVPNWTKAKAQKGPILMVLVSLWLVGRVAMWAQGALPYGLVAVADMAFLVALTALVARPLLDPQHRRQLMFLAILTCLILANALTHLEVLGIGQDLGARGLMLGLDTVIVLIGVMGGRVTPSFTSSFIGHANPSVKVLQRPKLDRTVMVATWGLLIADQVWAQSPLSGAAALIAAALHMARLSGWQGLRTMSNPILWVLHLGYLWLVLGLVLKGLADVGIGDAAAALHALTIGAIGTMTLAIMSRASLGHTGRVVKAHGLTVSAYVLVSLAALARLAVPLWTDAGISLVMLSGALWAVAFLLFFLVYAPILLRPRTDGRPG